MKNFILGILCATALQSLFQDSFGLEGYIEWCRNNWQPAEKSVPAAIILLLIVILFK